MSEPESPIARSADVSEHGGERNATTGVYGGHVQSLLDATRRELSSIPSEIGERVTKPLETALERAAEVHAALIARLESESEADRSAEPLELAQYRESAVSDVSEYLLETIRKIDAGSVVGSIFVDRLERMRQIVVDAPEEIRAPDDPGVYLPQRDDSALGRLRKVWLRYRRRLRSRRNAAPFEREVPLRQLLHFHVDQRLASALLPVHESIQQSMAQRYAALERDTTKWSFGVLELDDEFGLEDLVTLHGDAGDPGSREVTPSDEEHARAPELERVISAMERIVAHDIEPPVDQAGAQLEQVLIGVEADLLSDLQTAGTPLLRSGQRHLPRLGDPEQAVLQLSHERWTRWHQQVVNRIMVNHSVLALREELARHATAILCEARDIALKPVTAALEAAEDWLDAAGQRLEHAFDAAGGDGGQLVETLEAVEREADGELQRLFQDTVARDAQTALTDLGSERWKELTDRVAGLPDDLLVHGHGQDQVSVVDPGRRPFSIDLRENATTALSPAWPGLLSEAAEPLKARITQAWVGAEKLQNVIDYNLGSAIDELKEPSGRDAAVDVSRGDGSSTSVAAPIETARKLAADALRRSGELVDDLRGSLEDPWLEFARTFDAAVHDDWQDLVSQVKSDDMMSERWVGLRTRALRRAEQLQDRGESLWKQGLSLSRQRTNAARRLATRLIRRGRSAVGVVGAAKEDESTIADELRSAEDVRRALPLVYRRLFSLGVVTELSLLEGRGRDLVSVRRRYERWNMSGGTGTLVLTAPIGGGRTSFLEVLRAKVFNECVVRMLRLEERYTTADRLVEAISDALALPQSERTWAGLEAQLLQHKTVEKPTVFIIDNLEHLMLQTAGGTDQLQEMLALMVRTDHAVFWLAAISAEAWRYFEKAASMSTAAVSSYSLTTIGRKEAEEIVLGRHHRSGMTLRFTPPKDPSPLLKRRLRRARTNEREQEILQEMFFDGVFKHAGGGIALTLLCWLRSVAFEDDGDVVAVRPFQSMSFDQLNRLDLPRLFSLKAFVLHNTLTAGELARILRVPNERSALILEALSSLALIERAPADGTAANEPVDCAVERFRLSRLVVHPVVARLRGTRILY